MRTSRCLSKNVLFASASVSKCIAKEVEEEEEKKMNSRVIYVTSSDA